MTIKRAESPIFPRQENNVLLAHVRPADIPRPCRREPRDLEHRVLSRAAQFGGGPASVLQSGQFPREAIAGASRESVCRSTADGPITRRPKPADTFEPTRLFHL
jgi:hypothetical protein